MPGPQLPAEAPALLPASVPPQAVTLVSTAALALLLYTRTPFGTGVNHAAPWPTWVPSLPRHTNLRGGVGPGRHVAYERDEGGAR